MAEHPAGPAPQEACPCGRPGAKGRARRFADCCGAYLGEGEGAQALPAPDAEALMRSRYTAFVLQRADYLLATWHPSTRPPAVDFEPGVCWLGLQVKAHLPIDATHAEVAFVARLRDAAGRVSRLVERSRFVREQGRWYYVDGQVA